MRRSLDQQPSESDGHSFRDLGSTDNAHRWAEEEQAFARGAHCKAEEVRCRARAAKQSCSIHVALDTLRGHLAQTIKGRILIVRDWPDEEELLKGDDPAYLQQTSRVASAATRRALVCSSWHVPTQLHKRCGKNKLGKRTVKLTVLDDYETCPTLTETLTGSMDRN